MVPGMYSQSAWGGPVDPFILIKFMDTGSNPAADPVVSLVVFEWKDEDFIGIPLPNSAQVWAIGLTCPLGELVV